VNYSNKLPKAIQLGQQDRKWIRKPRVSWKNVDQTLKTEASKKPSKQAATTVLEDICMYLQLATQGIAVKLNSMGYALCK
jgi:hypothetical protein